MTPRKRAILFMVAFVGLWAVVESVAAGVLVAYSPYQVVFTRYAVHLTLMFAVWGARDPASLVRTRRPVFQLARSLLMLGMPASFVMALTHGVDPRAITSIFWLSPLLVLGVAAPFLHERASPSAWLGSLAAYAAVLLFTGVGPMPRVALLIFPLAMGATFGAYVVMTRSLRSEPVRVNLFYTAFGVAAALLPFMPRLWVTPAPLAFATMVAIGVVGFAGLYALDRATALAPLSAAAPFTYLQLPTYMVFERCLGRAHFGVRGLAACSLIAATGLYLWSRESRGPVEADGVRVSVSE